MSGPSYGASVEGHNGTSQSEVLIFELVSPLSVLLRNTALPWIFVGCRFGSNNGFWLKFALDFAFLVCPVILSLTIFSSHITLILLLQSVAFLSLLIFSLCEYCFIAREKPLLRSVLNQFVDDQHTATMFITYSRSMLLIATGVAILAVDFPVFPRRFAKTETYGRSVMDVGTSSFIFCLAVIDAFKYYPDRIISDSPKRRRPFGIFGSSAAILFYLGIGRSIVLALLDYPQHVSEYGVHWNFFITLSCLRMITKFLGRRFHILLGLFFAAVYQFILNEGNTQEWLLSADAPRNNFLSANREGIFSLLGYLSFYYFSSAIGKYIWSTGIRLKSWFCRSLQLLLHSVVYFGLQKCAELFFGQPSRRIVNLPYIIEMLVIHTIAVDSFLIVQLVELFGWAARMPQFSADESPFDRLKPCLLSSINSFAMPFFLLTNVLTGLININFSPVEWTDGLYSTAVITVYMFISCAIIHAWCRRRQPF